MANLQLAVAFAERNEMNIKVTDIPGDYPFRGPLDLRPSAMQALFDFASRCTVEGQIWVTPLEIMEESQRTHVAQSQASTQCPAAAPTSRAPAIETLNMHESESFVTVHNTSAP